MAFAVVSLELELSFVDDAGSRRNYSLWLPLPPTATWANVRAYANQAAARSQAISTAKLDRYTIRMVGTDDFATAAAAGSSVTDGAAFIFQTATTAERSLMFVPAIDPAVLAVAPDPLPGIAVDTALPQVQTLVDLVINGNGTVEPVGKFGSDITALTVAYRQIRP